MNESMTDAAWCTAIDAAADSATDSKTDPKPRRPGVGPGVGTEVGGPPHCRASSVGKEGSETNESMADAAWCTAIDAAADSATDSNTDPKPPNLEVSKVPRT